LRTCLWATKKTHRKIAITMRFLVLF